MCQFLSKEQSIRVTVQANSDNSSTENRDSNQEIYSEKSDFNDSDENSTETKPIE